MPRLPSAATVRVLRALVEGSRYGFDVMDATGLPSGTVYPILGRLERDGHVRSRWEDPKVARGERRPPRKYYRVTEEGRELLAEALARYRTLAEPLPEPGTSEA